MSEVFRTVKFVDSLLDEEPDFQVYSRPSLEDHTTIIYWEDRYGNRTAVKVNPRNVDLLDVLGAFNALRYGDREDWAKFQIQ